MMSLDKKALTVSLTNVDQKDLDEIKKKVDSIRQNQADLNSKFPAVKEFLAARGFTHVDQLDKVGLKELEKHLKETLARARNPNKE